jgi:hypothetical protein
MIRQANNPQQDKQKVLETMLMGVRHARLDKSLQLS